MQVTLENTPFFKTNLEVAIAKVKESAHEANESPEGFWLDESLCDYNGIKTDGVIDVVDAFALQVGDSGSEDYKNAFELITQALSDHF